MSQFYQTLSDRISEEANVNILSGQPDDLLVFTALGHDISSFEDDLFSGITISGSCTFDNFTNALIQPLASCKSIVSSKMKHDESVVLWNGFDNLELMHLFQDVNDTKTEQHETITKPIDLSPSVAVQQAQVSLNNSNKIELIYPLEEYYRPRYKSDYFTNEGKIRPPRYVADRVSNHFITLQVPLGVRGRIRIDWLTIPTESGDRYSMPYRFQQNNNSLHDPDCNPIEIDIEHDNNGHMKIYLVLIKSKQDELKSLQPLKPFHPLRDLLGKSVKDNCQSEKHMHPKQLIQKYQLDKSQLAFTFCSLSSDGKTYIPEWNTTVYSTILTEITSDCQRKRTIECPSCKHTFKYTSSVSDNDCVQETIYETGTIEQNFGGQLVKSTKKRKST